MTLQSTIHPRPARQRRWVAGKSPGGLRGALLLLVLTSLACTAWAVPPDMAGPEPDITSVTPDAMWTDLGGTGAAKSLTPTNRPSLPLSYRLSRLDYRALTDRLSLAPSEKGARPGDGIEITLPLPDGTYQRFLAVETVIIGEQVAALVPDMRTYVAKGVDDPTALLHLDTGSLGFRAYGRTAQGTLWIDPWQLGEKSHCISAWKRDFERPADALNCGVTDGDLGYEIDAPKAVPVSGDFLYTFRLAVTLTGEYVTYFGGQSPAIAQSVTTINRINVVYVTDVAVRFLYNWVNPYSDPATDPFPTGATITGSILTQNQTVLDTNVGSANYDIGHILTQGSGGGLAYLGCVCTSIKAQGGTGRTTPTGDPFDIDYVAHEVGHQMGGSHTFNGSTGSCGGGNRSSGNAYEPGSGTTIMAYAGICGAEDVQPNSDPYFHVRSLEQIIATRNASGCAVTIATGNTPPVADAGPDRVIPRATTFYLSGGGSDADGDAMTYAWEQYDLGAASPPLDPNGPLFRSYNLGTANYRYFGNTGTNAGSLPTVDRSLTMRFIVRDNAAGGGGVDDDEIELTVSGAPFAVTSPNGGEAYVAGQPVTVTWDVGGSTASSIVMWLLHDGNFTALANPTANDGSELVTMPCGLTSGNCTIWIEEITGVANGVHVYDVSNASFSLTDGLPDYAPYANWGDNIVANSANSGSLPTSLFGDTTSYVWYSMVNWGTAWACGPVTASAYIDENLLYEAPLATQPGYWNGWGPLQPYFSGGRHALRLLVDEAGNQAELDETNNNYARQWIWTPAELPFLSPVVRSQPPDRFAGAGEVPGGVTFQPNMDGLRLSDFGATWQVAAAASLDGSDYDVFLYDQSTGPEDGFDTSLTASTYGGSATDFVVAHRPLAPVVAYDLGVLRYGGTGSYVAERRYPQSGLAPGGSLPGIAFAQDQLFNLHEILIGPGDVGRNVVEITNVSTSQLVEVLLFNATVGVTGRPQAAASATVDGTGRTYIDFDFPAAGSYLAVVVRRAVDGLAPFTYDVRFRATPPDLATAVLAGSHGPVVPQIGAPIPLGDPVTAPAALEGDVLSTLFYFHFANNGPTSTPTDWLVGGLLDGQSIFDLPWGASVPGGTGTIYSQAAGALNVRGGRHTAGMFFDSSDIIDELFEGNNRFAEQWIWAPAQLALGDAVGRISPPDPLGGWDDIPLGLIRELNVDGLRTPAYINVGNDGYLGGWAAAPNPGSDIDLRVHTASTGAQDGFEVPLETSAQAGNATEFVLFDLDGPLLPGIAYDIGAVQVSGDTGYRSHATQSLFLYYDGNVTGAQSFGPYPILPGQLLGVHEFTCANSGGTDVRLTITVENNNGGADLALAVFGRTDVSGFLTLPDALPGGYADNGGPGANESVQLTFPSSGYFALAVYKVNGSETAKSTEYTIRMVDQSVSDVPNAAPLVADISSYPNPFNPQTKLEFVLEKPGRATVKIYDVQGRLVRTLVDSDLAAGRHEQDWRGVDDNGNVVASGVYLAQFTHPGGSASQRMVLLK